MNMFTNVHFFVVKLRLKKKVNFSYTPFLFWGPAFSDVGSARWGNMEKIVVYTGTRNIYDDMETSAKSLLYHTPDVRVYFLIEDDAFPSELPQNITTLNVSRQRFFPADGPNMTSLFTYMAMMRATMFRMFPDKKRVVTMDCDTIVRSDVSELWELPIDGYYFAAAPEAHRTQFGLMYTNIGVCFQNLDMLRNGKGEEIIRVLNRRRFNWVEQDVMNYLCQGYIFAMPAQYNHTPWTPSLYPVKIEHFAGQQTGHNDPEYLYYKNTPWGAL